MTLRQKIGRVLLGLLSVTIIAVATLPPTSAANSPSGLCIVCGERGGADAFLNLLLFVPLGVAFRLFHLKLLVAVLGGAALTFAIELAQLALISGRDASIADLLWNTLGVVVGYAIIAELPELIKPSIKTARALVIAWTALLIALPFVFAFALTPSVTADTYYWQWTPELGGEHEYEGELIEATLDGNPAPRWNSPHSEALEAAIARGTIGLRFVAAEPVPRRTTLFAIASERNRHLVRISIIGRDIAINVRRHSRDARFDYPIVRIRDGLRGVSAGDTVHLRITRNPGLMRLAVNEHAPRDVATRVSHAWTVLYAGTDGSPHEALLSKIFLVGLLLPLGYWATRGRVIVPSAAIGVAALFVLPWVAGLSRLSWSETATCLSAFALGVVLAYASARKPRARSGS